MRHAKAHFTQRLDRFAPQLQVQRHSLHLSNASTRWGSAKLDGSIRLNWRLIHFSPAVAPDYAQLRGQLKDDAVPRR